MTVERDVELEDRLRARLRELNRLEVSSYAVLRERAQRRSSSSVRFLVAAALVSLVVVVGAQLVERGRGSVSGAPTNISRCGQLPTFRPTLGVPTPAVASPNATASGAEKTVGIGVWSDCVRPQSVTVQAGQLVQWGAAEEGIAPEIVLDDGTSLGQVRHMLEFRFTRPGTYQYHLREFPRVVGTIVVEAPALQVIPTVPSATPSPADIALVRALTEFARAPGSGTLSAIPFADRVGLGLSDRLITERASLELVSPDAWVLPTDQFRGRVGRFSALDLIAKRVPTTLSVGAHPHCASSPVPPPANLVGARRVSVQPTDIDSCLAWWTVDLFVSAGGRIEAITLDLWDP